VAVAPAGLIDIELIGDTHQVDMMLAYLDRLLSPAGMGAFLGLNVGPYLQSRARDRFQQEGDDVSGPWAPLASSTVEIRQRQGQSGAGPINRRTGELEAYVTEGQFRIVAHSLGATLTYPGNTPGRQSILQKMETAQTGRVFPPTVPRPVLGMNERDLMYIVTTLAFFIERGGGRV
jgi:hypothetical protein